MNLSTNYQTPKKWQDRKEDQDTFWVEKDTCRGRYAIDGIDLPLISPQPSITF